MNDLKGLLLSYAYLFAVVLCGELLRVLTGGKSDRTRKFIHIGVGIWGLIAYWLLENWWAVLIPPASFVIINLLSFKWALFKSMEIDDKYNLGTVYYPLSLVILVAVFWRAGHPIPAIIGVMVMALGDGFASIVGQAWGKHAYNVWFRRKTWEGSLAMFVFSVAAVMGVLLLTTDLTLTVILLRALIIAAIATPMEGLSPMGLDNLTVPLCSGFAYYLLFV
ncbi:MAG TPA: phosphatidate cytidylyltransferase [bacterium]|nr:phosphatidate cytidylyltransferase [bacterium]